MVERKDPLVDEFTASLIKDTVAAVRGNSKLIMKLNLLEQDKRYKVLDLMTPPGDSMFILHQLVVSHRKTGLGYKVPQLAKEFESLVTEEKPLHHWWISFGNIMRAECVSVIGEEFIHIQPFGFQVNDSFQQLMERVKYNKQQVQNSTP